MHRSRLPLALACLVALGGVAEAVGRTLIPQVDDFINAPRALFGRTRAQVEGAIVSITAAVYPLPHGLNVGASRGDVERLLGEPQEMSDGRYLYLYSDGYPDMVEFYFRDGRVSRIEWTYWAA